VKFPPFFWGTPLGLNEETSRLFWEQPENNRHFSDSLAPVFGLVEIFPNAKLTGAIKGDCNGTHYINYHGGMTEPVTNPEWEAIMYMGRHEIDFFQHFLDNGVPHISLMQFASGLDPSDVVFVLDGWNTDSIPDLLRRYGFKDVRSNNRAMTAKKVILPKIVPVLHPLLTQNFVDRLNLNHKVIDKVVLVSRTEADSTKRMRLVNNQGDLEKMLRQKYGDAFVVFHASGYGIREAIKLFETARLIIGSHGGAMYHALWADRTAKVIELMPLDGNGAYPTQGSLWNMPPFAHLAIYTNSLMNGQPFYRWYEIGARTVSECRIGDPLLFSHGILSDGYGEGAKLHTELHFWCASSESRAHISQSSDITTTFRACFFLNWIVALQSN
jgi:hypothetical protein